MKRSLGLVRTLVVATLAGSCVVLPKTFECEKDADCVITGAADEGATCYSPRKACAYFAKECPTKKKYGAYSAQTGCLTAGTSGPCFDGVSAVGTHSCAHRSDDTIWCWGDNNFGELGIGAVRPPTSNVALQVRGADGKELVNQKQAIAGDGFSCSRSSDNTLLCWGHNVSQQLGSNGTNDRLTPAPVQAQPNGAPVVFENYPPRTGFEHMCARKSDSTIWCWGSNAQGQLGTGGAAGGSQAVPQQVVSAPKVALLGVSVTAGRTHSCAAQALESGGAAFCWGDNTSGATGKGDFNASLFPSRVVRRDNGMPLTRVTSLSAGNAFSCAVTEDKTAWCWGANTKGQLGAGTTDMRVPAAVQVPVAPGGAPLGDVEAVSAGFETVCALRSDRSVWCWGEGAKGLLGNATTAATSTPQQVIFEQGPEPLGDVTQISVARSHACALRADGNVFCWGDNSSAQLGTLVSGTQSTTAFAVELECPIVLAE